MELNLNLINSGHVSLSFQMGLIMLHGEFISAQWPPDHVGVEVCSFGSEKAVKVAFHPTNGTHHNNYQSFYFDKQHEADLIHFFKCLGFPCPQIMQNKEQPK